MSVRQMQSFFVTVQGEEVPALGLGTFGLRGREATTAVEHALDIGYRHVDTAAMYGNEAEVGAGLTNSSVDREDVFVTTKVWHDSLEPSRVRASAQGSLTKLGVEYVDLLLIHWPNPAVPVEHTLDEMMSLVQEGRVRRIGVSNFPPDLLERALRHAPVFCNQVEYHPLLAQDALLRMATEHDLLLTAYSPLAQGSVLRNSKLRKIAEKHERSVAQVVLRWLVQQGQVAAIPRSSRAEHRATNFEVWDFVLDHDDMRAISNLDRGERRVNPGFAPDWNSN